MQNSYLICGRSSKMPVERNRELCEVKIDSFMVKAPKLHIQEWAGGEVINNFHRWSQFVLTFLSISLKTLKSVLQTDRRCFRAPANEVQECCPLSRVNTA